jgi:hypothetical protein
MYSGTSRWEGSSASTTISATMATPSSACRGAIASIPTPTPTQHSSNGAKTSAPERSPRNQVPQTVPTCPGGITPPNCGDLAPNTGLTAVPATTAATSAATTSATRSVTVTGLADCGGSKVILPERQLRSQRALALRAPTRQSAISTPADWMVGALVDLYQAAARQLGVSVSYEAPDIHDIGRMSQLIEAAIETRPSGLVVSLPNPAALAPAIRHAGRAGIPVISINSGADAFKTLGTLLHVGEDEYQAGYDAGERMRAYHVHRTLCVIPEAGNPDLQQRCRGFAAALAAA